MKKTVFLLLALLALVSSAFSRTIKILQFNIWQEGTMVPGGFQAIADEIAALQPDFVTFSEVRNYKNTRFCDRIVAALAQKGKKYYSFFSDDSGLLSAFPIKDSTKVFDTKGTIYRLTATIDNKEVAVYTAHLDYENYAVYLPRGYDGNTWKKMPKPVTSVDSILSMNKASLRDEAIAAFIRSAKEDIRNGRLVFLGGDFNEDSHLDWTDATKNMFDHNGVVIPWHCSTMLYNAGFKDSYREKYPDPVTQPGFTFPADNTSVEVKKLAWAPDADERDRIDFIYYYPDKRIRIENAAVVGPVGSILRNKRVEEKTKDVFIKPQGIWPTDHKAVLTTFILK
ncbi:MAG: endonuclease/exonuclease/phosphatase family protein [Filimonas sp.]|nr:endonuclease/exonuclease/phosphatase family protein [Filimonas sp.]